MIRHCILVCMFLTLAKTGQCDIVTVQATSNIFYSGRSSIPSGQGLGALPPSLSFASQSNQVVTFSGVAGSIFADSSGLGLHGAEGGVFGGNVGTNITSLNGISGMVHTDVNLYLAGVFLSDAVPSVAPARLTFSNPENFLSISPLIGQTFFVGDGLTGSGVTQNFVVPAGATRLYLGFLDSFDPTPFVGAPGAYFDNVGSITANVSITAVPEPSSIALIGIGATLVWRLRKRTRPTV